MPDWFVLPYFQHTIRPGRLRAGLSRLAYAADTFEGEMSDFWLDGDLVVSPVEQFAFLQRFFAGSCQPRRVTWPRSRMRCASGSC